MKQLIKPSSVYNLIVSVHNSLWGFGNTQVKINVVLEIDE